jgi:hypothetical protein
MVAMCTAVVGFAPDSPFPVLLAGIRDEFHDRPWTGPGRHWPEHPDLVGGRDLLAGGTWLAAAPDARPPRVGLVLNGRGVPAPETSRLSRGALPLLFAATGSLDGLEYDRYDPFHLVCAEPDRVVVASWNGREAVERDVAPGLHLVVNSGLEGADPTPGPGTAEMNARLAFFRPLLAAAERPKPIDGLPAAEAWGAWLPVVDGAGLAATDERALVVRRELGEHRTWGTTSTTLVALRRDGLRYDFNAKPGRPDRWQTVVGG